MYETIEIEIRQIERSEAPFDLLYEADPWEDAIEEYLERGTSLGAFIGDKVIGVCVLMHTHPTTMEIMNLSVAEEHQKKGVGKHLIEHAIEFAKKEKSKVLEIGTGNSSLYQLGLYQKCGFNITGIEIDYYRKHYPEQIFENGIECRHMIRLRMEF